MLGLFNGCLIGDLTGLIIGVMTPLAAATTLVIVLTDDRGMDGGATKKSSISLFLCIWVIIITTVCIVIRQCFTNYYQYLFEINISEFNLVFLEIDRLLYLSS